MPRKGFQKKPPLPAPHLRCPASRTVRQEVPIKSVGLWYLFKAVRANCYSSWENCVCVCVRARSHLGAPSPASECLRWSWHTGPQVSRDRCPGAVSDGPFRFHGSVSPTLASLFGGSHRMNGRKWSLASWPWHCSTYKI